MANMSHTGPIDSPTATEPRPCSSLGLAGTLRKWVSWLEWQQHCVLRKWNLNWPTFLFHCGFKLCVNGQINWFIIFLAKMLAGRYYLNNLCDELFRWNIMYKYVFPFMIFLHIKMAQTVRNVLVIFESIFKRYFEEELWTIVVLCAWP